MPGDNEVTRDEKVENLMKNFTLIMMATLEGAFSEMADQMAGMMSTVGDAMAESLGGETRMDENPSSRREARAAVESKVKQMFAELRKKVKSDFPKDTPAFKAFIKDPTFDDGIRIVENHHLEVPMLTEHLTDADFAAYLTLIQSGDPDLTALLQELGDWQRTTPRFEK